jgi:DNA-binding NarL/FixJ family response regulator
MTTSIRILIADDHAQVRKDLRMVLQLADNFEVIGEAADGKSAVEQTLELHPDVVLMDLEMPGMSGLEAIRKIKSEGLAKVIVLTVHGYPAAQEASHQAGCDAFLVKGIDFSAILKTISQVLNPNTNHSYNKGD